jgi:2-keto-3-deoxy-L-rhamnonate aldolase RhmA
VNALRQRLRGGERLLWTAVTLCCEELPRLIQLAGFDFVLLDGLNGVLDSAAELRRMLRACNDVGLPAIYRSREVDKLIRATDMGADGVALMSATDPPRLRAFRDELAFYPDGKRRPNPFTPLGQYGDGSYRERTRAFNHSVIVWLFVEEGVADEAAIRALLGAGGIDLAYFGQHVSQSRPETLARARAFREACREHSIAIAGYTHQLDEVGYRRADSLKLSLLSPRVLGAACDTAAMLRGLRGVHADAVTELDRLASAIALQELAS